MFVPVFCAYDKQCSENAADQNENKFEYDEERPIFILFGERNTAAQLWFDSDDCRITYCAECIAPNLEEFNQMEYEETDDWICIRQWRSGFFSKEETVENVVPHYCTWGADSAVNGFTLILQDFSISICAHSQMPLLNEPAPKYIPRLKFRKAFAGMEQWLQEKEQIPRQDETIPYVQKMLQPLYTDDPAIQRLFSAHRLGLTYSTTPHMQEMRDLIFELHMEDIALPVDHIQQFCRLQCTEEPVCSHCPMRQVCNFNSPGKETL